MDHTQDIKYINALLSDNINELGLRLWSKRLKFLF